MHTLEQYNRGHSVKEAKKKVGKKYPYSPPSATIVRTVGRSPERLERYIHGSTATKTN
ncbi:MAG: hypothetical protein ACOC5D_07420 [Thermoplasmatota archaeon]